MPFIVEEVAWCKMQCISYRVLCVSCKGQLLFIEPFSGIDIDTFNSKMFTISLLDKTLLGD